LDEEREEERRRGEERPRGRHRDGRRAPLASARGRRALCERTPRARRG